MPLSETIILHSPDLAITYFVCEKDHPLSNGLLASSSMILANYIAYY
jgi:hypothetical protein